jgi:cell division protein FtsW (lipid II flippase)
VLTPLLYAFFVAVGAGMTIIQDDEWRLGDLIHATPLRPGDFSAIAEELGLLGALAVLALMVTLVLRALLIGLASHDGFEQFVAVGLGAVIGLQTLIILGGVVRLIPLTGITLPFISYGGSSLITNFLIVGLLLNVSNRNRS